MIRRRCWYTGHPRCIRKYSSWGLPGRVLNKALKEQFRIKYYVRLSKDQSYLRIKFLIIDIKCRFTCGESNLYQNTVSDISGASARICLALDSFWIHSQFGSLSIRKRLWWKEMKNEMKRKRLSKKTLIK